MDEHQDSTMTDQTKQSPSNATEEIKVDHQDSTKTDQTKQSSSSNSGINIEDSSVNVTSNINVPRERIVLFIMPYSGKSKATAKTITVTVKMCDNLKQLRNDLVKYQERGKLNLPQEGYYFIHKQRALNENQSFWVNGINNRDIIEILPKDLTRGSFDLNS